MTVYYVDSATGSDTADGTSPGAAWRSLDQVNAADLQPGDSVLFVRGGTWSGQLAISASGTAEAPITIGAYGDGADPVIDGSAVADGMSGVILNRQADHIHYENLDVTGGSIVGFRVEDSHGIRLTNVEAYGNAEDGFRFVGAETYDIVVEGGSAHHNGAAPGTPSGHGYVVTGAASDITFRDIETYANAQDGLQVGQTSGSGHVIERVHSHDNGYSGFNIKSGGGHVMTGVVSEHNGRYGLIGQYNLADLTVTGSRFVDNSQGGSYAALKLENDATLVSRGNLWDGAGGTGALVHSDGAGVNATFLGDIFNEDADDRLFVTFWGEAGESFTFLGVRFAKHVGNGILWFEEGVGAVTLRDSVLRHEDGRMLRYHEATAVDIDGNAYDRPDLAKSFIRIDGVEDRTYTGEDILAGRLADGEGTDAHSVIGAPPPAASEPPPTEVTHQGTGGDDIIDGTSGADYLRGGTGDDVLLGGDGNDRLHGGNGDDVLIGGAGADILMGAGGADRFVYLAVGDSTVDAMDTLNFDRGEGDRIDLTALDADPFAAGDQAFVFIGDAAFSGTAGELRFERTDAGSVAQLDLDGDGNADMAILVAKHASLIADDFLL